jgi:hypothetical protein
MKRKYYKIIFSIFFLVALTACEDFLDVNNNPNNPGISTLPLSAKFPTALVATVNQETGQLNQVGAFWGGYWGTNNDGINSFYDLKTYNGSSIRTQREGIPVWETAYNNILYFQLIKDEATASGAPFYTGASKIMQGWLFLRLTDVYNNIPFEEAAQGTAFITPGYEDGQVVYEKAIALISDGIEDIKSATITGEMSDDILFKGNKLKWAKFGNTIKLRALIRQSEADRQNYIASQIQVIMEEGNGFLGAGENAFVQPGYLNTSGKMNPFWASYYRDAQGNATANFEIIRPTEYLLDQYKMRNDPRMEKIYTPVNGEYKGVVFGNPDAGDPIYDRQATSSLRGPNENGGLPGGLMKSYNQPSILMSAFESLFLQAEAVQRGWIAGDPKSFYDMAIRESFIYLGATEEEFIAYMAQEIVNLDNASDKIARIIEQKWLALNSINSFEAWADYRRLGIPEFPATAATGISGRPLRFMYPETERGTNTGNVSAQGSDLMTVDKIWWDK